MQIRYVDNMLYRPQQFKFVIAPQEVTLGNRTDGFSLIVVEFLKLFDQLTTAELQSERTSVDFKPLVSTQQILNCLQ